MIDELESARTHAFGKAIVAAKAWSRTLDGPTLDVLEDAIRVYRAADARLSAALAAEQSPATGPTCACDADCGGDCPAGTCSLSDAKAERRIGAVWRRFDGVSTAAHDPSAFVAGDAWSVEDVLAREG